MNPDITPPPTFEDLKSKIEDLKREVEAYKKIVEEDCNLIDSLKDEIEVLVRVFLLKNKFPNSQLLKNVFEQASKNVFNR